MQSTPTKVESNFVPEQTEARSMHLSQSLTVLVDERRSDTAQDEEVPERAELSALSESRPINSEPPRSGSIGAAIADEEHLNGLQSHPISSSTADDVIDQDDGAGDGTTRECNDAHDDTWPAHVLLSGQCHSVV